MLEGFKAEKLNKTHGDYFLIAIMLLLLGVGLCAIFSITYEFSWETFSDPYRMFWKQLFYSVVFGIFAYGLSFIDLKSIRKYMGVLVLAILILLLLPQLPGVGIEIKGGRRWVQFGPLPSFQPAELAKPFIILYLAHLLDKKKDYIEDFQRGFLPSIIVLGLSVFLILLQSDLSTAFLLFAFGLVLLFLGGCRFSHLISCVGIIAVAFAIYIFVSPHAQARVVSFFNGPTDYYGVDHQIMRALGVLSIGGFLGEGLGTNIIGGMSLPEGHSDFAIAALGESIGFLGLLFICVLFLIFAVRGFWIAWKLRGDLFYFLIAAGVSFAITFQVFVNIAVNCRLLPTTGLPCPFFSAGCSSLFATLVMCGMLISISGQIQEEPNE